MYADEESKDGLAVQTVALQFSKKAANSHATAQTLVGNLISQFQKGKWERHDYRDLLRQGDGTIDVS